MKNLILAGVAVALVAASVPAGAQHETNKEQILGTWTVDTLKATSGDQITYPLGEHPSGFVTMTPERIWLLFVDSSREAPAAPTLTDAEAIAMMKSQVAADFGWHKDNSPRGYCIQPGNRRQRSRLLRARGG